ncbi:MAG: septum formation initiator family protein [Paludibacteraceae bacterium]|nr:septum formation initiator family protein [Paludibacteraceae bacterium]
MKKVIQFFRSNTFKYLLVVIVFLVAMFTSSEHNIQTRIKNAITIRELKQEIDYYKEKSEKSKQRLQELESDRDDLEKFARERYRMHAPDEDVYVVEYE